MEDNRKSGERGLRRRYQSSRFEEELWAIAYEQLWPLIRKALIVQRPPANADRESASFVSTSTQKIGA